jgi:hypothetical protein
MVASTSHNPVGLHSQLQGELYIFIKRIDGKSVRKKSLWKEITYEKIIIKLMLKLV